jgi:hypothetical protein
MSTQCLKTANHSGVCLPRAHPRLLEGRHHDSGARACMKMTVVRGHGVVDTAVLCGRVLEQEPLGIALLYAARIDPQSGEHANT